MMDIRINKETLIYQILFVLCILVPYFYIYELTFAVWTLTAAVTICGRYSHDLLKQIACFTGILVIAAIVTLFREQPSKFVIVRDIAYLLKPILGLIVGYQLFKKIRAGIYRLIVVTGVVLAIFHLLKLFHTIFILNITSMIEVREMAGYFSDFEIYALVILVFHKRFKLNYSVWTIFIFAGIIGLSSFMYLARTNYIQFIVLYIALKGYFEINRKSITIMAFLLAAGLIGYGAIWYMNPKRNGNGIESLLYKIKIAPIEPFKTHIPKGDGKNFHDNYRSYENILTVQQVTIEGPQTVLFGKGLGSSVDLKRKVYLQDEWQRFIPLLHNGFMTVLLKSGLAGVVLFIISIYLLFKNARSQDYEVMQINYLMVGTGVFMIISAWVFMALYFKADTKSVLIGLLLCYREALIKKGWSEKQALIDL